MLSKPLNITVLALIAAFAVNLFYYYSGTDLTTVVSRTLFADMLIVLTLVPITEAVRTKNSDGQPADTAKRVKSSMQLVAVYVIGIAVITAVLFNLFAEPLVAAKLNDIAKQADKLVEAGEIAREQADQRLQAMQKFYTVGIYLPVLIISNLIVGFVSSIPAALLIKK